MNKYFIIVAVFLVFASSYALADNRLTPNVSIQEFSEVSGSNLTSSDFYLGFDDSTNNFMKSDPTDANILSGTVDGAVVGGTTPAAGDFTTLGATGATTLSGAVTFSSTWTFASTAVASAPIINPGRDYFTICGEATTINNNTVFYGPDVGTLLPNAGNGQACDINAVGNVTETKAGVPAYTGFVFQVLGMTCRNEADANADISFTLRTAAGATVPSVTCTISDGDRDCVADVQTTTAIASAATVAIAAASSGDIGDANGFVCTVSTAY